MSPALRGNYSAHEVAAMLAVRIESLVVELLPNGVRAGPEYTVGSVAGERGGSLSVRLTGTKAGIWSDFADGIGGDALDLVAHVLFRGDLGKALAWASRWLGLETGGPPPMIERQPPPPSGSGSCRDNIDLARKIWREARDARGTPVEAYLNDRGLHLPDGVPIRYHARCPRGPERLPAMVARMTDVITGEFRGVHRTFLEPGDGERKMMIGPRGVIALTPEADIEHVIGISEGIESGMSAAQRHGFYPLFAACNAGGVKSFPVIPHVETIWIFADNGRAGEEAAAVCAERWRFAGREAVIIAPAGYADWNDVVQAQVAS